MTEYTIKLEWDSQANVWIATNDDVPGLVLESGSFDALIERVRYAVPELPKLNQKEHAEIPLRFKSERHGRAYV